LRLYNVLFLDMTEAAGVQTCATVEFVLQEQCAYQGVGSIGQDTVRELRILMGKANGFFRAGSSAAPLLR